MLEVMDIIIRLVTAVVMVFVGYVCVIDYQVTKERERKIALKRKAQRLLKERENA